MGNTLRTTVRTPGSTLLTSRRAVDLCRVGSCLCR
ncbi:MAG: putative leader peptide [Jatrophihabitans sp.]